MANRIELQKVLEALLQSPFVYFQPPESVKMHYPCIRYNFSDYDTKHANNIKHFIRKQYTITYIDTNPDSTIPDQLEQMAYCSFVRSYKADNLNHWVYELYY